MRDCDCVWSLRFYTNATILGAKTRWFTWFFGDLVLNLLHLFTAGPDRLHTTGGLGVGAVQEKEPSFSMKQITAAVSERGCRLDLRNEENDEATVSWPPQSHKPALLSGTACTSKTQFHEFMKHDIIVYSEHLCVWEAVEVRTHSSTWHCDELDPFISYSDVLNGSMMRHNRTLWT